MPEGNSAHHNGNEHKGNVNPQVAKETESQRTEQTQRDAGEHAMYGADRTCTSPDSIKPFCAHAITIP